MKRYRDPERLSLAEHQALAARVRQIQCEVDEVYRLVAKTWGFSHPVAKALERLHLSGRNPLDRVRCRLEDVFYRDPAFQEHQSPYFGNHAEPMAVQDANSAVS